MLWFLSYVLETILKRFESMQQQMVKFGKSFVCFSLISTSLLNLSYLYEEQQPSYTYVFAIVTRPQIFLVIEDFDYIIIAAVSIYVIAVLFERMPFRSHIAIFGELLRMNSLNFCFELCRGKYKLIPQSLLILIFLNDSFFVQGTLNIQIINFQLTRNQFTHKVLALMMSIQMILYTNHLKTQLFHIYVTINSALLFLNYALNQPYKYNNMSLVMACIEFITFYFGILKVANLHSEFSSELILIPFIMKIIWVNFQKRTQKTNDPNSIEEILIKSSVLIKEQKYLGALKLLETKRNISILIKAKRDILYKSCLKEIQTLIYTNIPSHTKMGEAVNLLMESENINNQIQTRIINLIRSKILLSYYLKIAKWPCSTFSTFSIQLTFNLLLSYQNSLRSSIFIKTTPKEEFNAPMSFLFSIFYCYPKIELWLETLLKVNLGSQDSLHSSLQNENYHIQYYYQYIVNLFIQNDGLVLPLLRILYLIESFNLM